MPEQIIYRLRNTEIMLRKSASIRGLLLINGFEPITRLPRPVLMLKAYWFNQPLFLMESDSAPSPPDIQAIY